MTRILLVFHTSEGQTAKIAHRLAGALRAASIEVDVREFADAPGPDGFDGVVVGDSIHAGHHSRALTAYLGDHRSALAAMPTALFQVSLTSANPDAEHTTAARALVDELEQRTGVRPDIVGLFAGALKYTKYGWLKRRIIRVIARKEGGDTDTTRDYEYTDWAVVETFARDVAVLVQDSHRESETSPALKSVTPSVRASIVQAPSTLATSVPPATQSEPVSRS